jgi:hypothetical protein
MHFIQYSTAELALLARLVVWFMLVFAHESGSRVPTF